MRISYIANPNTGNGYYRAIGPMSALASRGHQVQFLDPNGGSVPLAQVRASDVLHIHRYVDRNIELLMRDAKRHGVAVCWDEDDDFGALPRQAKKYKEVGGVKWEARLAGMRRIFNLVDVITTPSVKLANRLRDYGAPRVEVIENYIPSAFLNARRQERVGTVIGWVAGDEHSLDVERLPLIDVLTRLLDGYEELSVVTLGVRLGIASDRYTHLGKVHLLAGHITEQPRRSLVQSQARGREVPGGLAHYAAMFDVGIAPLADIPLNHCRSNIKLKEYAAAGTPWIASAIGPYVGMGESQGGRVVANDRWYEELRRLIESERQRRKLAKRALRWARDQTLDKNIGEWTAVLTGAIERSRARS